MPIDVSVIMPAFRLKKQVILFEQSVKSIVDQTYKNWELIIVCDGGDKEDIEIATSVVEKYANNIKLYRSKKQMGPEIIRNMASKYIKGKYIIFQDSDDFSVYDRFEKLLRVVNNGSAASNIKINYMYQGGESYSRIKSYSGKSISVLVDENKARPPVHLPSMIISSDEFRKMGGFEKYKYGSDALFAIKLGYKREILGLGAIPIYPEPLFEWNRHSFSVTTMAENIEETQTYREQRDFLSTSFRHKYIREMRKSDINTKMLIDALRIKDNLQHLEKLDEIQRS